MREQQRLVAGDAKEDAMQILEIWSACEGLCVA